MGQSNSTERANEYYKEYKEYKRQYEDSGKNDEYLLVCAEEALYGAAQYGHEGAQDKVVKNQLKRLDNLPVEEDEEDEAYNIVSEVYDVLEVMASSGHIKAKFLVAGMKRDGYGTSMDSDGAEKIYEELVAKNYQPAIEYMLDLAVYDLGTEKAFEIYKKASAHDIAKAKYLLAICYEHGLGVEKNLQEALKCYHQANYAGIKRAKTDIVRFLVKQGYQEYIAGKYKKALALCNEAKQYTTEDSSVADVLIELISVAASSNVADAKNFNYVDAMQRYNQLRAVETNIFSANNGKKAVAAQKSAIEKSTGLNDEWLVDLVFNTSNTSSVVTQTVSDLLKEVPVKQALMKASLPTEARLAYWANAYQGNREMGINLDAVKADDIKRVTYDEFEQAFVTDSGTPLVRFFNTKDKESAEKPDDYKAQAEQLYEMTFLSAEEQQLLKEYKETSGSADELPKALESLVGSAFKMISDLDMKQPMKSPLAAVRKLRPPAMAPKPKIVKRDSDVSL